MAPEQLDKNDHQRAGNLYPRTQLHPKSRPRDRAGRNSGRARLADRHQNRTARPESVANCSETRRMSMRDFITRVVNTPVAAKTTPHIVSETIPPIVMKVPLIVVDTSPPIVVETDFDSPRCREGSPEEPFYWDIESRSVAVLGSGKQGVGARAYAEHPTTEVLCVSFARGNGQVETWVPGEPIPEEVSAAAADPRCPWVAHNAAFERAMLECILVPLHGWPMVPVERHVCTMSLALATAYPGSLEGVAEALGLVNRKDVARERRSRHVEA